MAREAVSTEGALRDAVLVRPARKPFVAATIRLFRKKIAVVALIIIVAFYLTGILAPYIAPYDYTDQDLQNTFQSPSWEHPLGTDRLGRDMLSRVIWAARTTAIVTLATLLTGGVLLGITLGLIAGYVGGRVDTVIMRTGDIFLAMPGLLMLILINATLRSRWIEWAHDFEDWSGWYGFVETGAPDYLLVFSALSLFAWVGGARLIRSQVLALRETDYVMAARAMGASRWRIIFRHLLPNVSNLIIVGLSAGMAGIVGSEIALSWLGLGVKPPNPSFGALILEWSGISNLRTHPTLLLFPATVVALLILSWNLLGDALNDVLNPRRSGAR
jgi:ABC-type dipeptide/oligopeptide/nickel transport system permease subunit